MSTRLIKCFFRKLQFKKKAGTDSEQLPSTSELTSTVEQVNVISEEPGPSGINNQSKLVNLLMDMQTEQNYQLVKQSHKNLKVLYKKELKRGNQSRPQKAEKERERVMLREREKLN